MTAKVTALVKPLAGPFLILASILILLKDFLTGFLFPRAFELPGVWLTTFCFQGRSLRAGHIPALNAHVMGGIPFVPDPQSGWMNIPAMGLFTVLRCDLALRMYLILLPILAGLGMYWFLRSEGLARASATVGGLVLALPLAGSKNFMLPWVAGWIAWSAVLLAAGSRFWHARETWRRLLWAVVCALAWGQLGSAHFSTGLAVGTGFLIAYLLTQTVRDVGAKRSTWGESLSRIGFLLVVLFGVNLVAILPRLVYVRRTPLGIGFAQVQQLVQQFSGVELKVGRALPPPWPLSMALSPGIYQGAMALGLCLGGFLAKERRALAVAFAGMGMACYVLTLPVTERTVQPLIENQWFSHTYLHGPIRIQPGVFIALAILAGLGVDAWIGARSIQQRLLIAGPGLLMWGALLAAYHPQPARLALLAIGAILGVFALLVSTRVPGLVILIPMVVAAELWLNGRPLPGSILASISREGRGRTVTIDDPPTWTKLDVAAYLRGGSIASYLQTRDGGRFVTSVPERFDGNGYFGRIKPSSWGLMADQQSMLFDLREAQGYNATLPLRFWKFVRAVEPGKPLKYPPDYFIRPPPTALDLLQIGWVVGQAGGSPPAAGAVPVARQGRWALFRLPRTPPMASVVGQWRVVGSPDLALDAVTATEFDPGTSVIVEEDPGLGKGEGAAGSAGNATYRQLGDQAARIEVEASRPAIVLIRNTYDPNWHASVDGRRVRVLPADFVVQGVPVPAGRHVVSVWYDDPTIGYGLAGSTLTILLLLGSALALYLRRQRPDRDEATVEPDR